MANGTTRKKNTNLRVISPGIITKAFGMLSNQLLAIAEDKEAWDEISEKIRQQLLAKLKSKKPKQLRNRKKK